MTATEVLERSDAPKSQTPLDEAWHGLRDTLPFMFGSIPFGLLFGTLATGEGLSPLATMAMSLFVFSGSAQFIAVVLLGAGSGIWVVWFATFVLNLRHLLYAATLVDHVRHLSQAWRFPLAAFLTDETFAVMERRYRTQGGGANAHWYYIASCIGMYLNWQTWTFLGITIGQRFPQVQNWGLEFAMVVTFIGIVVPLLTSMPYFAAAVTAGLVAVIANPLPYKLGLMLAALAGIVVGVVLDIRKRGLRLTTEEDAAHLAPEEKKTWA
ncbi:AzlC family ABC transporter permease [Dongia sp.]|uniref:AzlC family ABC transporter permease n=1 Tax=Dongia sp. TaxID=1977262 RepID=UPI003750A895